MFPILHQKLIWSVFSILAILLSALWYLSVVVLICIYLVIYVANHFFTCLFTIHVSSLVTHFFKTLAHFFKLGILISYYWLLAFFIYSASNPLLDLCFANVLPACGLSLVS